ncbi:RNase H domain-containing protein [Aphis craccivora]|uniref:RNase H domain-containing protein n=1 Tax=Aphis craccivora TaxID=307492 RepID=A0A6G0Z3N4_APHCR|nr:RNase H domain-containing protein [Aphis craccivora]
MYGNAYFKILKGICYSGIAHILVIFSAIKFEPDNKQFNRIIYTINTLIFNFACCLQVEIEEESRCSALTITLFTIISTYMYSKIKVCGEFIIVKHLLVFYQNHNEKTRKSLGIPDYIFENLTQSNINKIISFLKYINIFQLWIRKYFITNSIVQYCIISYYHVNDPYSESTGVENYKILRRIQTISMNYKFLIKIELALKFN